MLIAHYAFDNDTQINHKTDPLVVTRSVTSSNLKKNEDFGANHLPTARTNQELL